VSHPPISRHGYYPDLIGPLDQSRLIPSPESALETVKWHGGEPLVSADAPQIMLAQRLTPGPYPDGKGHGCVVGGFIQHTVLTPDSVTSRVVHRWPDEVGKLIDA
jgi:hypothetical protein